MEARKDEAVSATPRALRLLQMLDARVIEVDDAFRVIFDNRGQLAVTSSILDAFPASDRSAMREKLLAVLRDGVPRELPSGGVNETGTRVVRLDDEGQRPTLGLSSNQRTRPGRDFPSASGQQKLDIAREASGVGLWHWHLPSGQVEWDERMYALTGSKKPLNLQQWIDRLAHPDDRKLLQERKEELKGSGKLPAQISRIVLPDGEIRWLLIVGTIIESDSGKPEFVVGGAVDVTEQQRLVQQLRAAQKMEALGHLTAGVAHNFNNMLMIIQPCLEEAEQAVTGELKLAVGDARSAAQRAREIVSQLMALAGQQNSEKFVLRTVEELCGSTARLCQRSFPDTIKLRLHIDCQRSLECIDGSLEQVLGNLLLNARDALLAHTTKDPEVLMSAKEVSRFGEEWLELTVSDNGPGVPEALRTEIFEPFVTTKGNNGTGLGLATSQALIQRNGGQLAYRPSAAGGAEFLVLLPLSAKQPVGDAVDPAPQAAPVHKGRLLIVDDEVGILGLLRRGLAQWGYEVHVASEAEAALDAASSEVNFDLILLDRSLGTATGSTLVSPLRERQPQAALLFFTGEFVTPADALLVDGVIQKPMSINALARTIADQLAQKSVDGRRGAG